MSEVQRAYGTKKSRPDAIQWRYHRRKYLRWQIYALVGATEAEAREMAQKDGAIYSSNTIQCSVDGGQTWHTAPRPSAIPIVRDDSGTVY